MKMEQLILKGMGYLKMTNQEKQALSQAVADKYGIEAYTKHLIKAKGSYLPIEKIVWLADDWARLMPLAVKKGIDVGFTINISFYGYVQVHLGVRDMADNVQDYKDHSDEYEAVRIAICRALLESDND